MSSQSSPTEVEVGDNRGYNELDIKIHLQLANSGILHHKSKRKPKPIFVIQTNADPWKFQFTTPESHSYVQGALRYCFIHGQ